ncbi:ubiquitin family protein [Pelomyxa schiedti]|nr:ubiquitin family protein [Pelomyxa schiedti]
MPKVNIKCASINKGAEVVPVEVDSLEITVGDFKGILATKFPIPAEQQRLIYAGHVLKDYESLSHYGVQDGHTVHMVRGTAQPSQPAQQPQTDAQTQQPQTPTPAANAPPPSLFDLGGSGGFPGLDLLGGGGGGGMPDFRQFAQQLQRNPEMMRQMMNNPVTQSIMNNPELLRSLITSNPQMQELINRNPEIGHILNDPQTLRQMMEMTQNPELMREMMRHTDRAMSNLEAIPDGFNQLRRLYTDIQEPMLNAATGTDSFLFGGQPAQNTQQQQPRQEQPPPTTPNTQPLPNPWAAPAATGGASLGSGANPWLSFGASPLGSTNSPQTPSPATPSTPATGTQPFPTLPLFGFDPAAASSMLQSPIMQQVMQQVTANPELLNRMIEANPFARSLLDAHPEMRTMLQDPNYLRSMTELLSGAHPSSTPATPSQPATPQQPPAELYRSQLQQLKDMGFFDEQENIQALIASNGNVNRAVERLLQNFP